MSSTLFRRARVGRDSEQVDLLVTDGRIARVAPAIDTDADVVDLADRVVLPGLVDGHAHLDKTLWTGPWIRHETAASIADLIANGQRRRPELGIPHRGYITALLEHMVTLGTSHVRSHVDIDPLLGLSAVEAVRAAADGLAHAIDVELVAFPQAGILISPGTAELLDQALAAGVETIGGIDPAGVDGDPVRHLDLVFELADRHGVGVDIHLHDRGTLGLWQFERIIERAAALGLGGKVVISHGYALIGAAPDVQDRLIARLAEAGIAIASTAPSTAMPLGKLRAAGVPLTLGNDGVRDLWSPNTTADMLERVMFQVKNGGDSTDSGISAALDAATVDSARALGLDGYGLSEGDKADFVAVDARNAAEAVMTRPTDRVVVKHGRVVARDGALLAR
ncbi:amidohydrolase [Stackebrandtia soli]|uniref:amidohydrolase n=1 Tax=Stackebrandtia soli TaxID=1892856 RepID=UPI0039ED0270